MKRVTLADIARATGFSVNTVSRALNDKGDVSPETRETIRSTAQQLGYRPDRLARGLRTQSTRVIGVVVTDVANPFFGALVKSISHAARSRDYRVILQDSDESVEHEQEAIEVLLSERIDGILICPVQIDRAPIDRLARSGLPFVLVGRYFDDLATDYAIPDDRQGGYLAAKHLIDLGHRRIGMINGPEWISSAVERRDGFVAAHREASLSVDERLILHRALTTAEGHRAARELLKDHPDVTAIATYSDYVALGVATAVRETGRSIPDDIALIGFDDIDIAASLAVPLSTIRAPIRELGFQGVDLLCEKIAGGVEPPVRRRLPVELVPRRSTLGCDPRAQQPPGDVLREQGLDSRNEKTSPSCGGR